MDPAAWSWFVLLVLTRTGACVATGKRGDTPANVTIDLWDGVATIRWDPPRGAPEQAYYQVQECRYRRSPAEWSPVPHCARIRHTHCDLGPISTEHSYQIRVGLLRGQQNPSWCKWKRIEVRSGRLLRPLFRLLNSSTSARVWVDRKPLLRRLYPSGVVYTLEVYPQGEENKVRTLPLDEDQDEVDLQSLLVWQVYCVRVRVEVEGYTVHNTSAEQCLHIQPDLWLVTTCVLLSAVGILALLLLAFCCFLKRPVKLPLALKTAVSSWHPLMTGVVTVETVTDRGWLLISSKMENKEHQSPGELEDWRGSVDSGVSVGHTSPEPQEDSGCGSLKGMEVSLKVSQEVSQGASQEAGSEEVEVLSQLDGSSTSVCPSVREDSGLGLAPQEGSGCMKLDNPLPEVVVGLGAGYRSQSPSSQGLKMPEPGDGLMTPSCDMATPAVEYGLGHETCVCTGHESCIWCPARKHYSAQVPSAANRQTECSHVTAHPPTAPSYLRKTLPLAVAVPTAEETPPPQHCPLTPRESYSLPVPQTPLLLEQEGLAIKMDTLSLALCDVKLNFT